MNLTRLIELVSLVIKESIMDELSPLKLSNIDIVYSPDENIYYLSALIPGKLLFSVDAYDTKKDAYKAALDWMHIEWEE